MEVTKVEINQLEHKQTQWNRSEANCKIVFDQVKVFDQVGLINLQNNAADSLSRLQLGRPHLMMAVGDNI